MWIVWWPMRARILAPPSSCLDFLPVFILSSTPHHTPPALHETRAEKKKKKKSTMAPKSMDWLPLVGVP